MLEKKLDRKVHLVSEIDEAVIGGVRLQFGDYVYDGTVNTRLNGLVGQ